MRSDVRMVCSHSLYEILGYTDTVRSSHSEIGHLDCEKNECTDLPRSRRYC